MISRLFLVLLICLPTSAFAFEESVNFCLDKEATLKNEVFALKYSEDEKVIMLVALRSGLCDLLAKKIIELNFAIGLYDEVETLTIFERFQEDAQEKKATEFIGT